MINTSCDLLNNSFQLATGRIE